MKRKIFGFVALAAFAITTSISVVSANVQENTIWVYADDGTTTSSPDCPIFSLEICTQRHEYNPETKAVGAPLSGEENIVRGQRP